MREKLEFVASVLGLWCLVSVFTGLILGALIRKGRG